MYCLSHKADVPLLGSRWVSFIETLESDGLDGGQDVASIASVLIDRSGDPAKWPAKQHVGSPRGASRPSRRSGLMV